MQLVIVILHKTLHRIDIRNISLDAKKIITNCESQTYQKEIIENFMYFQKLTIHLKHFGIFQLHVNHFVIYLIL